MSLDSKVSAGEKFNLKRLVANVSDSIVSRTILKNTAGNVTLFAFAKGQGLSKHTAPFDALVYICEGEATVTIGESDSELKEGEAIIMPANIPHALNAKSNFKMLLVMIKNL
ncbi:MAG: cupin domain-containing protein [Myxococcota bacterium]